MKEYGFNIDATHAAAIFEKNTEAAKSGTHNGDTEGLIIGSSEWIWISKDNARRICAALKYFSETSTKEIERMARERFADKIKEEQIEHYHNHKKYIKLKRNEIIEEKTMQSWNNGTLQPLTGFGRNIIGETPSNFPSERNFYNPEWEKE